MCGEGSTGDVLTAAQLPGAEYMRASFSWTCEQSINQLSDLTFTQGVIPVSREPYERAVSCLLAGVRVRGQGVGDEDGRLSKATHTP